ncbi:glycerophosphodiester phosphodiesterase family protein [uncultured Jatrophihabitans sp.]|uniref:glycerophosphodiester phosphodiesterase family protein n=1 Tax=uncultured Jatrophihabitans sp. TaxID=1610747 RepID=UPI0035CA916E
MARHAFLDAPTPLVFAHRGFAAGADAGLENSMRAFEAAVRLGCRYLETDVRVSADGVALAFHDASLDRVTDRRGRVDAQSWARLRHARIGGREAIPLLTDVLATWPDVRVNLDVKSDRGINPTIDAIRRTGALDRVCVGSFATSRIAAVRRALGPALCTSLGPRAALRLRLHGPGPRRTQAGQCAQVPARIGGRQFLDARYLAAAQRLGLQVHAWTVNDPAEMTRLLDLGVDGIITDRVDLLRTLLVERGEWFGRSPTTG